MAGAAALVHRRTRANPGRHSACQATGDETSPWDNEQRWMIRSLSCWVGRRADEFLEAYQALEAGLDAAREGSRLWLAAASIWFHRENWKRLLVDELPSSVADLADPAVRLIIGFAYARSAPFPTTLTATFTVPCRRCNKPEPRWQNWSKTGT